MPHRVQLRRAKGWRMPPNTVKVSRPGPWGNPFKVGVNGTAADCVRLFEMLLAGGLCVSVSTPTPDQQRRYHAHARRFLWTLRGKNLACWCPLDKPCHADVLLKAAERASRISANAGLDGRRESEV